MAAPTQFTTADGGLVGDINGSNTTFSFIPNQGTLLYGVTNATGYLLFRNGVLIEEHVDFVTGSGYFTLSPYLLDDIVTVLFYSASGPSKMSLSLGGLTAFGTTSLLLSPQGPAISSPDQLLLFRNGLLQTPQADFVMSGPWIVPAVPVTLDDGWCALIGVAGISCSTSAGTITGTINGTNPTFTLPALSAGLLLFRNGQFLTRGTDFLLSGTTVTMLGAQVPQNGDTLTAQLVSTRFTQVTTADGTLVNETATLSTLSRNGLLMTQTVDGLTSGNTVQLSSAQIPQDGDIVTVEAWTRDIASPDDPAFNLPTQYSSAYGGISGTQDGTNNVFTINVPVNSLGTGQIGQPVAITQIEFYWNGLFMTPLVDYLLSQNVITMINRVAGGFPTAGDNVTALVFFQ